MIRSFQWRLRGRVALRAAAVNTLKALRLKNPYQMNRE
jgi:ribosomal protein L30/L7E